jgi:hypothetical protein
MSISRPVTLATGKITQLHFHLSSTQPAGNIVENPDAKLSYLEKGIPDRWRSITVGGRTAWTSTTARVTPKTTYRCGAILKDPKARVKFSFAAAPGTKGPGTQIVTLELPAGQTHPAELRYTADEHRWGVAAHVQGTKPLAETIERLWVVPEIPPPAR